MEFLSQPYKRVHRIKTVLTAGVLLTGQRRQSTAIPGVANLVDMKKAERVGLVDYCFHYYLNPKAEFVKEFVDWSARAVIVSLAETAVSDIAETAPSEIFVG